MPRKRPPVKLAQYRAVATEATYLVHFNSFTQKVARKLLKPSSKAQYSPKKTINMTNTSTFIPRDSF